MFGLSKLLRVVEVDVITVNVTSAGAAVPELGNESDSGSGEVRICLNK